MASDDKPMENENIVEDQAEIRDKKSKKKKHKHDEQTEQSHEDKSHKKKKKNTRKGSCIHIHNERYDKMSTNDVIMYYWQAIKL